MSIPRTISFRIDADKVAALDALAKNMDRDRSYLLNQAVEGYLDEQKRLVAMVEEGLRASENGELIDDADLDAQIAEWAKEKRINPYEAQVEA